MQPNRSQDAISALQRQVAPSCNGRTPINLRSTQAVLLAALLASGCGTLKDKAYSDYSAHSLSSERYKEVRTLLEKVTEGSTCDASATPQSTDKCKLERNRVLAKLTASSDEICNAHLQTIYGNDASSNIILGSLATVFTTVAAGVGSVAAKTNFAAAGAIASAERSLFNEVIYKSVLAPAIHQKIVEERARRRMALNDLYATGYVDYPTERVVSEVVNYHYTCSFMLGLQLALKEGSSNTQLAELRTQVADAEAKLAIAAISRRNGTSDERIYEQARERFNKLSAAQLQLELTTARAPALPVSASSAAAPPAESSASQPPKPASAPEPAASAASSPASAPAPAVQAPPPVGGTKP